MTSIEVRPADAAPTSDAATEPVALDLVEVLCKTLAAEGVAYCHWKSNEAIDRSMTGDNDLDLLVGREHRGRFLEVLARLGFKAAALPAAREVPAVVHYYGFDAPSGRLVHVHAHYRLVLGDDTTKNFWLPIEHAYLASRSVDGLFPLPAPEFELAVLVLRLVLKHSTWDAILQKRGRLSASERRELEWLQARTDWATVDAVVAEHLPFLLDVWPQCRRAVQPGAPLPVRVQAADRLAKALAACARRPQRNDTTLRLVRRTAWAVKRRVSRRPAGMRLTNGGAVVAIIGGDGSGKSTAVRGIADWLSQDFMVLPIHVGRPPKAPSTYVIRKALGLGHRLGLFPELESPDALPDTTKAPSTGWLAWHTIVARNRHRLYVRSRRIAANGGVVICDRFPMAELHTMDGARTSWARGLPGLSRLGSALVDRETRYYSAFTHPNVVAVLCVDPEVAVRRKTDEEEGYVRRRNHEVVQVAWDENVVLVDANGPAAEVLEELKRVVWEQL